MIDTFVLAVSMLSVGAAAFALGYLKGRKDELKQQVNDE